MKDKNLNLRLLRDVESDYKMLEKWYQEEEIYSHFEQKKLTYEEVKNKYFPRTLIDAKVPVFMIEYGDQSIGIIQYQLISKDNKKLYNINCDNSYEIDIFIGELQLHNKGIGKRCINLLTDYLFKEKQAKLLVMCPLKGNISAIQCYKNCNFKIKRLFKTEDTIGNLQEFVLMIREK